MPYYHVTKAPQPGGDHEVHQRGCMYMPAPADCLPLGQHPTCHGALARAREHYPRVRGCYWCCLECHPGPEPDPAPAAPAMSADQDEPHP
ncbi:hypothetical protein [Desulfocurvus vexinensis]|uniref:hypothetical protein n=1 Tax=Desulfocurvus vexinensis TaxID=399548 RepID=UPI0004BBEEE1|nr:hypothetical protein [Desulfocurvus vexinensis]